MQMPGSNYERIESAIHFIRANFRQQPSLQDIARAVNLSEFHFQRLFAAFAGVTPKQFLQYTTIEYTKSVLQARMETISSASFHAGLSGTSRLHDMFVKIEGMTPGEYRNGGHQLLIKYVVSNTPFGNMFVASTPKGICSMSFTDSLDKTLIELKHNFPKATIIAEETELHRTALSFFQRDFSNSAAIQLHLKGTPFQLKVWQALISIPFGKLTSYGAVANQIGNVGASRATGTAIGRNPVAVLIPCHRVIQSSGNTGSYMWGEPRKSLLIAWEASHLNSR